jgi:hypothetical protein
MRFERGALAPLLLLAFPVLADVKDDLAKAVVRETAGPSCSFAKRDRFDLPVLAGQAGKRILWLFRCDPAGSAILVLDDGLRIARLALARPVVEQGSGKVGSGQAHIRGWITTGQADTPKFDRQSLTLKTWIQINGTGDLSESGLFRSRADATLGDRVRQETVHDAP